MWRLSQFVVFLFLLRSIRPQRDPQAVDRRAQLSPDKLEIKFLKRELYQMSEMMQRVQGEIKILRDSFAQLTEMKAVPPRLTEMESTLSQLRQDQNGTAVRQGEVESTLSQLQQDQTETASRQQERFTEFCRMRPMGMSTGVIPDSSVTASSMYSAAYAPHYARVGINGVWIPQRRVNANQWLKVDLGQDSVVYGVITQGRPDANQWPKTYKLAFSRNDVTWTTYVNSDGSDKVFQGNRDRFRPKYNTLWQRPVTARYVRFHPLTYQSRPSMRVEILGCPADWQ